MKDKNPNALRNTRIFMVKAGSETKIYPNLHWIFGAKNTILLVKMCRAFHHLGKQIMKIQILGFLLGISSYMIPSIIAKNSISISTPITGYSVNLDQHARIDTSITVYGNCSSCKKAIEKAAKSVEGVESASWDKKKKILTLQYDAEKTSLELIEKAIIAIGYDTEHMRADDSVYEELHHCCKYDRKPQ